jgi:hypothetical protein
MSKCTCKRSPTGQCIGWHRLTQEQYEEKKRQYEVLNFALKEDKKKNAR